MTDTQTDAITLEQRIAATPEAVFEFLVDPEKLLRWMGTEADIDPRPGGRFWLNIKAGDGENAAQGEYLEVDPPNRVRFSWGWVGSDDVPPGSSIVTFDLRADGPETVVTLTHTGLPGGMDDQHLEGWSHFLPQLVTVAAYEASRGELLQAELELSLQREKVADMRRSLPLGPVVADYEFATADGPVRLTELFTDPTRPLVLYHFMFGKAQADPCPMCSMWADGWNGVADHLSQNVDFALVTSASVEQTSELAEQHGWQDLRWLSAADNSFKADIGGEDSDGNQMPFASVYRLVDGQPRLTWSGGAHLQGDHWRGIDLLSPVWHILDLTPIGRLDWMPSL